MTGSKIVKCAAIIAVWIGAILVSPLAAEDVSREPEGHVVMPGSTVLLVYTLRLEDGTVLDRTEPGKPVAFVQGADQVIAGLNEAVLGMKLREQRKVVVPPAKAYGEKDPKAMRPILLSQLPEGAGVPGTELGTEDEQGRPILMRVDRVEGDHAIVDFNHPLAGQTLYFEIEVVAIE